MTCERCGNGVARHVFQPRVSGGLGRKRERICDPCHTQARESARARQSKLNRVMGTAEVTAENARWERIFARFVDPDYYARRVPAWHSSITAFSERIETCRG